MIRLGMKNLNLKILNDLNREAAKILALWSGKVHKYEYPTGEDISPSNQQQITEQAKFTYSPLGKAFKKQIKTIEDQGNKQIKARQRENWSNSKICLWYCIYSIDL